MNAGTKMSEKEVSASLTESTIVDPSPPKGGFKEPRKSSQNDRSAKLKGQTRHRYRGVYYSSFRVERAYLAFCESVRYCARLTFRYKDMRFIRNFLIRSKYLYTCFYYNPTDLSRLIEVEDRFQSYLLIYAFRKDLPSFIKESQSLQNIGRHYRGTPEHKL